LEDISGESPSGFGNWRIVPLILFPVLPRHDLDQIGVRSTPMPDAWPKQLRRYEDLPT
jgi:hypothetical protein